MKFTVVKERLGLIRSVHGTFPTKKSAIQWIKRDIDAVLAERNDSPFAPFKVVPMALSSLAKAIL